RNPSRRPTSLGSIVVFARRPPAQDGYRGLMRLVPPLSAVASARRRASASAPPALALFGLVVACASHRRERQQRGRRWDCCPTGRRDATSRRFASAAYRRPRL